MVPRRITGWGPPDSFWEGAKRQEEPARNWGPAGHPKWFQRAPAEPAIPPEKPAPAPPKRWFAGTAAAPRGRAGSNDPENGAFRFAPRAPKTASIVTHNRMRTTRSFLSQW